MTLDETQSLMDEIISMNTGDDRPAIILIEHEMNVIHRVCQRVVPTKPEALRRHLRRGRRIPPSPRQPGRGSHGGRIRLHFQTAHCGQVCALPTAKPTCSTACTWKSIGEITCLLCPTARARPRSSGPSPTSRNPTQAPSSLTALKSRAAPAPHRVHGYLRIPEGRRVFSLP